MAWKLSPEFAMRMTGFPVELIDSVMLPQAAAMLREGTPHPEVKQTLEVELQASVDSLQQFARSDAFAQAVLLSNPAGYRGIRGWIDGHKRRPSKARASALAVVSYLQRVTMKNDTASFFGPVFCGRVHGDRNLELIGERRPLDNHVLFTHWCARAIADALAEEDNAIMALAVPRLLPTLQLTERRISGVIPGLPYWHRESHYIADDTEGVVAGLIDGRRTAADIADCSERHTTAEVKDALSNLSARGVIKFALEIPEGITEPVQYLRDRLASSEVKDNPAVVETLALIDTLERLRADFQAAETVDVRERLLTELGREFSAGTRIAATRGEGKMYADRSIIYEDCHASFDELTIGGDLSRSLEELSDVWDLLWLFTEADHAIVNQRMMGWFSRRFDGKAKLSFLDYAGAWIDDWSQISAILEESLRAWRQHTNEMLQQLGVTGVDDQDSVELTMDEVRSYLQQHRSAGPVRGAVANPDIIVCGSSIDDINSGRFELLLGELHADRDLLSHGAITAVMPEETAAGVMRVAAEGYAAAARTDETVVDVVRTHNRKTNVHMDIGLPYLEAQGVARPGVKHTMPLAETEVHVTPDGLRLWAPSLQSYVRLMVARVPVGAEERTSLLRPFSFARRDYALPFAKETSFIPRVKLGPLVVQRKVRRVHFDSLPEEPRGVGWTLEKWLWMRSVIEACGMGSGVYGKVDGERKGMYVNADSYMLLAAFFRVWRRRGGWASFVEVQPDRSELWLADAAGRYSAELRMGIFRRDETD